MNDRYRRVVAVLGLAVLGVTLALAGSALNVASAITGDQPTGEVRVAGDNVTFEGTNGNVTLVQNLTAADAIEVSVTGDQIAVTTTDRGPLTPRQKRKAREIARSNATVGRLLEEMDAVELSTAAVKRVSADAATRVTMSVDPSKLDVSGNGSTYTVGNVSDVTVERDANSVTIASERAGASYVEDRAVVRVRNTTNGEPRYGVVVDLASRTIVDATDWRT